MSDYMNDDMATVEAPPDEQPSWMPKVESVEQLEEALEAIALIELEEETGQCAAIQKRIDYYQYTLNELRDKLKRKRERWESAAEAFWRARAVAAGVKVYNGAFGTIRITKSKWCHRVVDKRAFIDWARSTGHEHLMVSELKPVDTPDSALIDGYIKRTGEIPEGVVLQDAEGCTIHPVTTGLK